jgi:outer membrane protein assembly factor BamB
MFLKRVSLFIFLTLSLNLVVAAAYAQSTALLNSLSVANAKEVMYDSFGNIYLIANYEENSTINNTLLTSNGAKDILIAKFSAMGALIWKQNFGGSIDDEVCSFQFDAHQNLYVCGTFQKSMILKVANSTKKIKSKGGLDGFLMQLNAESGSINWITTLGTIQDDKTYSLTLDPADGVLISGASISISGSVHEVNLYRFSQKDGSLLTNRTVFKTTSLVWEAFIIFSR